MSKTIITTDWHVDYPLWSNAISNCLMSFVDNQVRPLKPDLFIHLGDVFHTIKPSGGSIELVTILLQKLADCCGTVVFIVGNHEMDAYKRTTALDFVDDIAKNIMLVTTPTVAHDALLLPYQRTISAATRKMIRKANVIYGHQGVDIVPMTETRTYGARGDAIAIEDMKNASLVVLGHIHRPCITDSLYVLGSPYPLKFPDADATRNFMYINTASKTPRKLIPYDRSFRLLKTEAHMETLRSKRLTALLPPVEESAFYTVLVTYETLDNPIALKNCRTVLNTIYGEQLVESHILSVIPKAIRSVQSAVRDVLTPDMKGAPEELLARYLKTVGGAYYTKNPEIVDSACSELSEIIANIATIEVAEKKEENRNVAKVRR